MAEKAILFDTTKCMACRACQVACKQWWELPAVPTANRGTYENPPALSAATWNRIRFKEVSDGGTVRWLFTRHACMHCSEAVCVWVCPSYARQYNELGYVTIDYERCIGCGRCEEFCPFGVPSLGSSDVSGRISVQLGAPRSIAYKCIFCKDRVGDGLSPACVKTCPPGALQFGEREEMVQQGKARVAAVRDSYPRAYLYGETEVGGSHLMYVLTDEPAVHGLPDNPRIDSYPLYDETNFPAWYARAIADGSLPAFPPEAKPEWYLQPGIRPTPAPPEPAWPAAAARPMVAWAQPAMLGWLGVGVIGVVGWVVKRRVSSGNKAG